RQKNAGGDDGRDRSAGSRGAARRCSDGDRSRSACGIGNARHGTGRCSCRNGSRTGWRSQVQLMFCTYGSRHFKKLNEPSDRGFDMEQLKQVLKYQFWILLDVALILPIVGWFMSQGMKAEAAARSDTLKKKADQLTVRLDDPNETWPQQLGIINTE